jgi:hypothetical protein
VKAVEHVGHMLILGIQERLIHVRHLVLPSQLLS